MAYVETDVRDRISNFIASVPDEEFAKSAAAAIKMDFTKEATIVRTEKLNYKNFVAAVGAAADLTLEKPVRARAIKIYASSGSFDQANSVAQSIIIPMTQSFDRSEMERIIEVEFENGQIRHSHEFPKVLEALKLNKNVDPSWWDPLLKSKQDDVFLHDLFFVPPPPQADELQILGT